MLTKIESRTRYSANGHPKNEVLSRCDCGDTAWRTASASKKVVMCKKCRSAESRRVSEKYSSHPMYAVWVAMNSRCSYQNNRAYKNYGGRGLQVDESWRKVGGAADKIRFETFCRDMGDYPLKDAKWTLERIDNNLGYSKDNCVWATFDEQANNRRKNRKITALGETLGLAQWARKLGVGEGGITDPVKKYGLSIEEVITRISAAGGARLKWKDRSHIAGMPEECRIPCKLRGTSTLDEACKKLGVCASTVVANIKCGSPPEVAAIASWVRKSRRGDYLRSTEKCFVAAVDWVNRNNVELSKYKNYSHTHNYLPRYINEGSRTTKETVDAWDNDLEKLLT